MEDIVKENLEPDEQELEKTEDEIEEAIDELTEAQSKLCDLNEQFLRLRAEYDNFRKRTLAEKMQIYANATSDAVSAILPAIDNIERAAGHKASSPEDVQKGLKMIEEQIKASFESLGVKVIGEKGEKFDPALHNAVSHVDDDSVEDNTITEVLQKGYMLGDRVIRHAMVQVAN